MFTQTLATAARRLLGTKAARRLFLDRQAEILLAELDPVWSLSETRARVVAIIDETHDTKTFVLAPNAGWQGHQAGQFTTLEVEIDGVRTRRCYSLCSAPGDRHPAITVKRAPGGQVSNWLHDELRVGDVVGLGAASGDFVLPAPLPARLLLLSGGSGVTPVMSMLRELAARDAVADVVFINYARSRADVIFRDELTQLAARHAGLRLLLCIDDGFAEARFAELVPDFAARDTFLCGPPAMMACAEKLWAGSSRLRRERFAAPVPRAAGASVQVSLIRSGKTLAISGQGSLLQQLEAAGERPGYGCRMGICHTCRCRKQSGTVENLLTGAVSSTPDEDIQLCISVPRSDLELGL